MRSSVARCVAALSIFLVSCLPCDCKEATLIGGVEGTSIKVSFESPTFGDDRFTVTIVKPGAAVEKITGTYENEDDKTIKFKIDGGRDFLSIKSGAVNGLSCDKEHGQFTISTPTAGGGPALDLKFQCTKKK